MSINIPLNILSAIPVALFLYYAYKIVKASLSPLHALPGPERDNWMAGNLPSLYRESDGDYGEYLSDTFGPVVRVHSLLGAQPQLFITDPDIATKMLITEPDLWTKPSLDTFLQELIFGPGLLSAPVDAHKRQRKMLNPLFTGAQMRILTSNFYDIGQKLRSKILSVIDNDNDRDGRGALLDIMKLASAAALDAVGSAGLGHDFDALKTDGEYKTSAKLLFPTLNKLGLVVIILPLLSRLGPYSFRAWLMNTICPWLGDFGRDVIKLRDILGVLERTGVDVYTRRLSLIETEADGQVHKADILSNLVRASREDSSSTITESEAMAQINTMIFAGHETTANLLSRLLQHLALNPELQSILRGEIEKNQAANDLDYDSLMALPLLDAACRETLRLHSPVPDFPREATRDTVVSLSQPIKAMNSERELTEIIIPKGTRVDMSVSGMNRSIAIWGADAKEFRMDRWFAPLPETTTKVPGVFSSLLTFSGGPRACIGWRFALLETKVILSVLLQNFSFEPSGKPGESVRWMSGPVLFPRVDGQEQAGPQLPLRVIPIS